MLNLGDITFGITVNTQGLQQGARVLEGFGKRIDNAMAKQAKGFEYNTSALQKQEAAAVRALQQVQNMSARIQNMRLDPQVKLDGINQLSAAYEQFVRRLATPVNRTMDPLGFQRASLGFKDQLDQVNRSLLQQQQTADASARVVSAALQRQEQAAMRAAQQVQSLNDQILRAANSGAISGKAADAFMSRANNIGSNFQTAVGTGNVLDSKAFLAAQLQMKSGMQALQRDVAGSVRSIAPLKAGIAGVTDALSMTIGPLNGFAFRMRAGRDMMDQYGVAAGGLAAVLSGLALTAVGLGKSMLDVTIAYQKAEVMLVGLTQNSAVAAAELSFLRDVANQSGLSFQFLAPQFAQFIAAAQGSGQSLERTNDQFERMAMIGGTMHFTSDQMNRVLLAFDQMLSAGKIMGDDMRQLRNVMPGAFEMAAKAADKLGVSLKNAKGQYNEALNPSEFITAFLDEYMKLFNIDLAKPINTLQADLQRITLAWELFILKMSEALGASEKFQAVFDGITNGLTWMANNMDTVLGVVGALTGALTGLFAIMAANAAISGVIALWGILSATIAGLTTALSVARAATVGFSVAQTGAMLTTAQLTAAQNGLNAAMAANPIGLVVRGLIMLGGVAIGAKMAYDALNDSVAVNQRAMADTSSIRSYIEEQKKKGKQIAQVTAAMKSQVLMHIQLARAERNSLTRELMDRRSDREKLEQPFGGLQAIESGIRYRTINLNEMKERADAEVNVLNKRLEAQNAFVDELRSLEVDLNSIATLPSDNTFGGGNNNATEPKDKNGKTPNEDRGLRALNDIINRARDADQALSNMWRGPSQAGLIDALNEVQRRLFDMDTDQLKRLTELMSAANIDVSGLGGIESALTVLELRTRSAEEAVKKFSRVWDDLRDGQQALEDLNREVEYLAAGGDPNKMWLVQASNRARDTIRELTTQDLPQLEETLKSLTKGDGSRALNDNAIAEILKGAQGSDKASLEALNRALGELGYSVADTGDAAADAQNNLTSFFRTMDSGRDSAQRASNFFSQFNEDIRAFETQLKAMRATSMEEVLQINLLERAATATRYLDDVALEGLRQQLVGLGYSGENATQMLAAFYRMMENNEEVLSRQQDAMQSLTDSWTSFADNSISSLQDVLMEGESFKESMLKILADLGNTILNAAIFDPLKQNLRNVITDMMSGKPGVGAGDIAGVLGNGVKNIFGMGTGIAGGESAAEGVATPGLDAVGQAAQDAAGALKGNFLSGILQSVMGITTKSTADQVAASATMGSTLALYGLSTAAMAATAALTMVAAQQTAQSFASTFQGLGSLGFAEGGQVFGPGGPKADMINAWLSNGEFVVNADATKKNLRLLHAINSGTKIGPKYASGGEVGHDMIAGSLGPTMSGLTSDRGFTKIDARSTFNFSGSASEADFEQFKQLVDERDQKLREDIPYLVDERVIDSSSRGRF